MSDPIDVKSSGDVLEVEVEAEKALSQVDHASNLDDLAKATDYKADAVEAENAEHDMTVLQAVRAYPMASFWAVVMSSTIVGCLSPFPLNSFSEESRLNTLFRLWSLTMSFSPTISSPYLRSRGNLVYHYLVPQPANMSSSPSGSLRFKCLGSSVLSSASSSLVPSPAASDTVTRP